MVAIPTQTDTDIRPITAAAGEMGEMGEMEEEQEQDTATARTDTA